MNNSLLFLKSLLACYQAAFISRKNRLGSVADPDPNTDPDPSDPYVFGPPGSGSISQRHGSGSFYHQAKIVRKTSIPTVLLLFLLFIFEK